MFLQRLGWAQGSQTSIPNNMEMLHRLRATAVVMGECVTMRDGLFQTIWQRCNVHL